jgi:hypothetical protein
MVPEVGKSEEIDGDGFEELVGANETARVSEAPDTPSGPVGQGEPARGARAPLEGFFAKPNTAGPLAVRPTA